MSVVQAQRTLVKSPPELWEEISDPESLARHLGGFGEIRITRTEPETAVAWEGEQVRGTVTIAASGWGTQVSLSARIAVPEPEPAPPDPVEHTLRVVEERVVRVELPVAPEPPPEPEAETEPIVAAPAPRSRFFARLFRRAPEPEPLPEPEAVPAPAPPPERRRRRPPCELRISYAVIACRVPQRPAPPAPPPAIAPVLDPERVESVLAEVLDHLGAAHHRPFSRG